MDNESEVIQQRINVTRAALAEKFEQLDALGATVGNRIETAADAAEQTIQVVNDAVQAVKKGTVYMWESSNIIKQVEKRPWTILAGATAVAFVGSSMYHRRSVNRSASPQPEPPPDAVCQARPGVSPEPRLMPQSGPADPKRETLGVKFQGEIAQLRGLALGMLFGVLRDVVKDSVSKPVALHVDDLFESITNRMGGRPVNGRMLPERKRPDPVPPEA